MQCPYQRLHQSLILQADPGTHDLSQAHGLPLSVCDRQLTVGCACRVALPFRKTPAPLRSPAMCGAPFLCLDRRCPRRVAARDNAQVRTLPLPGRPLRSVAADCGSRRPAMLRASHFLSIPAPPPPLPTPAPPAPGPITPPPPIEDPPSPAPTDSASAHRRPATGRESGSPCVHASTCKGARH